MNAEYIWSDGHGDAEADVLQPPLARSPTAVRASSNPPRIASSTASIVSVTAVRIDVVVGALEDRVAALDPFVDRSRSGDGGARAR